MCRQADPARRGRVQVSQRTRLPGLGELAWPARVPGGLRAAAEDDADWPGHPTSDKIYAALGYQPVADMANLVIAR